MNAQRQTPSRDTRERRGGQHLRVAGNISADSQFGIAYNAALKLCTLLLHTSGYRPEKTL